MGDAIHGRWGFDDWDEGYVTAFDATDPSPGDDTDAVLLRSRQDCDDLIELLRMVRERLP